MHIKKQRLPFFRFFFLSLLFASNEIPVQASPLLKNPYIIGTATTAYLGYLYCSTPATCTPTIEMLQMLSAIPVENQSFSFSETAKNHTSLISGLSTIAKGLMGVINPTDPFIISVKKNSSETYQHYRVMEGTAAAALPDSKPLWIAACGWDPCYGPDRSRGINENIRVAKRGLLNHIINGPALFLAQNDARCAFNFGQNTDQNNIDFAYQQAATKEVILYGRCRGATAVLGWMQHYQSGKNVRAIILESPALSLHAACQDVSMRFTHSKVLGLLAHRLFAFYYPNYNHEKALQQEKITPLLLAQDTPIFIGNIKQDSITSDRTVTNLVKQLRKISKNPIYYFISDESITHAYLSTSTAYQQAVNAFLKKYNLPCDENLAEQGQELLEQARLRAQELAA